MLMYLRQPFFLLISDLILRSRVFQLPRRILYKRLDSFLKSAATRHRIIGRGLALGMQVKSSVGDEVWHALLVRDHLRLAVYSYLGSAVS